MIPNWVKSLKTVENIHFVNKAHPNFIGNGFSRHVYRDGLSVWKIGFHDSIYENEIEYNHYISWLKGDLKLPEGFAIPHMELIDGIVKADFVEGTEWDKWLMQNGMTQREAWNYMDGFIEATGFCDTIGCNVLVDSFNTHWIIDLGAEDGE